MLFQKHSKYTYIMCKYIYIYVYIYIYYLGSRHMLLDLGTVWPRPKRAGARAFCAHEHAGARPSVRVSERVSARVRAYRRAGKRADERESARIGARVSERVSELVCVGSRR